MQSISIGIIMFCIMATTVDSALSMYPHQSTVDEISNGIAAVKSTRPPQAQLESYFSNQSLNEIAVGIKKIKLLKSSLSRKLLFEELSSSEEVGTAYESSEATEPESTELPTTDEQFSNLSEAVTSPKSGQQTSLPFKQGHTTLQNMFPTPPPTSEKMTEPATSDETSDETTEPATSETATEPETSETEQP